MRKTNNVPVFIVGLHRTGSTLLKNMMDLNSEMCMMPEELHLWSPYPWRVDMTDICKEKNMDRNEAKKFQDFVKEALLRCR